MGVLGLGGVSCEKGRTNLQGGNIYVKSCGSVNRASTSQGKNLRFDPHYCQILINRTSLGEKGGG